MNIKQQAFDEVWEHLPIELRSKCSSCSETTVHIVMKSMADLGISQNAATGFLADKLGKSESTIKNRIKRGKKEKGGSNEPAPKLPKSLKKSEDDNDSQVESVSQEEIQKIQDELAETQKRLAKELAKEKKRKDAQAAAAKVRAESNKRENEEKKKKKQEEEEQERQAAQLKKQTIENKGTMPVNAAFEVFGIRGGYRDEMTEETAKIIYRGLAKIRHPDMGGSDEEIRLLNVAYNTIKLKGVWKV